MSKSKTPKIQLKMRAGHRKLHPMHKTKAKDGTPTHVSAAGTRKYQCNGPIQWSQLLRQLASKIGGPGTPEGVGIRAALAFALSNPHFLGAATTNANGHVKAVDFLPVKVKAPRKAKPAKVAS